MGDVASGDASAKWYEGSSAEDLPVPPPVFESGTLPWERAAARTPAPSQGSAPSALPPSAPPPPPAEERHFGQPTATTPVVPAPDSSATSLLPAVPPTTPAVPAPPAPAAVARTSNLVAVSPWGRLGSALLETLLITVTLGIGWVIWAAMIAGSGQTPAKRLVGHQVVTMGELRPAGIGRMFWMRGLIAGWVASLAFPLTLGVLLFMPFWDKNNQNVWDKVSNTMVVYGGPDR